MSSVDPPAGALPERPDLEQLRRQAKELKRAALAGDPVALGRLHGHLPAGTPVTLAVAQLAIAREYGFASWARLKAEVEARTAEIAEVAAARTAEIAERVADFLARSLTGSQGAVRVLHADPALGAHDIRTAAVLGDAARVRQFLTADPGLAVRADELSGWPPLLYVCMSRWHLLPPAQRDIPPEEALRQMRERAAGMVEVARLLLDAGADPNGTVGGRPEDADFRSPLFAAAGCANHPAITELLMDRGARADDRTVYLAAFHVRPERYPRTPRGLRGPASRDCLRLLLRNGLPSGSTALAAPISLDDAEGVRLMLDAGADANRPLPADLLGAQYRGEAPMRPVFAAVRLGCHAALVELLLEHGADASGGGYRLAVRTGRQDLADVLRRHGARDDVSAVDRFLDACARADRDTALRLLQEHPGLVRSLTDEDRGTLVAAADRDDADAVRLMLELGFPVNLPAGPGGATALHAAAGSGSVQVVRLLIEAGADLDVLDGATDTTPLSWAVVGSRAGLGHNPHADWVGTVRALLDAGADPAQAWAAGEFPSMDVARLLVERGINVPGKDVGMMRQSLGVDP